METRDRITQDWIDEFRARAGWAAGPTHRSREPQPPLEGPRAEMIGFLRDGIFSRYEKAKDYALAIQDVLFAPERGDLHPDDRQRCLITILGTRAEDFPLAIHIYVGLMEGIPVEEIRNIFFLVGVYSGVPAMVRGIDMLEAILKIIEEHKSGTETVQQRVILGKILAAYPPGASAAQKSTISATRA